MTTNGEKVTLLAEILRVSIRGATAAEISDELALSPGQARAYIRFLKARSLLVQLDRRDYFPSEKGLAYLASFDEASELVDLEPPQVSSSGVQGANGGVYWDKAELAARMREIIGR